MQCIQKMTMKFFLNMTAIVLAKSMSTVHGFILGIAGLASSTRNLTVHQELESGEGNSYLILDDFVNETCCILELKKTDSIDKGYAATPEAAAQILKQNYAEEFIGKRYKTVYSIGIGFVEKSCEILSLGNLADKEH